MTQPDAAPAHAGPPSWFRQAVDFGALVAFGLTFAFFRIVRGQTGDEALVNATWALVGGSIVAVVAGRLVERRWAWMPLIVGGFALVFGVLTLLTQDDLWVKLKVTILNASLSVALIGGYLIGKQPLKALLGTVIPINDRAWRILTLRYGVYFAGVAIVNELVRNEGVVAAVAPLIGLRDLDPADAWVSFRGVLWIASSAFGLANVPLIMRNLIADRPADPLAPNQPETLP